MRDYDDYLALARKRDEEWRAFQREEWWKKIMYDHHFSVKGDYLETVRFLDTDEKNDISLMENHTNLPNSEWSMLFSMLGQVLIDWCIENKKTAIWSYTLEMTRMVDQSSDVYLLSHSVKRYQDSSGQWVHLTDDELDVFSGCAMVLCDVIDRFFTTHRRGIPCDWNRLCFSLDDVSESCRYGRWMNCTDGYLTVGNNDDEHCDYDIFVECM